MGEKLKYVTHCESLAITLENWSKLSPTLSNWYLCLSSFVCPMLAPLSYQYRDLYRRNLPRAPLQTWELQETLLSSLRHSRLWLRCSVKASDWSISSMDAADWLAIGIMEYQTLIEKYSLVSWKQHLAAHRVHRLNGRDQKLCLVKWYSRFPWVDILKLRNHGTSRDMRLRIFSCHPPPRGPPSCGNIRTVS